MKNQNEKNAEEQMQESFTMQGDILDFKPIPCLQYETEIFIYINNIKYTEKQKTRKGRTEFEPDTAFLAKWYSVDAVILNKDFTEKGDSLRFNLHTATAKCLIDDAQQNRSRLMSAAFTADKRFYDVVNEDGTILQKTAVYPRLYKYHFLDCFDSKKAEKVIKGGK